MKTINYVPYSTEFVVPDGYAAGVADYLLETDLVWTNNWRVVDFARLMLVLGQIDELQIVFYDDDMADSVPLIIPVNEYGVVNENRPLPDVITFNLDAAVEMLKFAVQKRKANG